MNFALDIKSTTGYPLDLSTNVGLVELDAARAALGYYVEGIGPPHGIVYNPTLPEGSRYTNTGNLTLYLSEDQARQCSPIFDHISEIEIICPPNYFNNFAVFTYKEDLYGMVRARINMDIHGFFAHWRELGFPLEIPEIKNNQ